MVNTIRATGTSHIRTVPNYNHVCSEATTYGYVTQFPSTLDVFFLAPSAVADLGARDLLVRVTDSDLPDPLATESYYLWQHLPNPLLLEANYAVF